MKLTDKKVLKMLEKVRFEPLEESISAYPDNERYDRSDMEFFADEVSYCVSNFNEDGHVWRDDLEDARELLRETKNGKRIPLNPTTMKPQHGYWPSDIDTARNTINEYNRLRRLLARLQKQGFYGKWYTL